jgi:hypothetical protein
MKKFAAAHVQGGMRFIYFNSIQFVCLFVNSLVLVILRSSDSPCRDQAPHEGVRGGH